MATNLKTQSIKMSAVEFVDLSGEPTKAKIVRQGFDVPTVKLDVKKVDQFVGDLAQIPAKELPRVVSQQVPAGTKVAAGTVVDLVLAPRTKIPFAVFDELHLDLATKTLDAIDSLYANTVVKKALLTYASADLVPEAEKTALKDAFGAVGVHVNESDPSRTFSKAFASAQGGLAFQG